MRRILLALMVAWIGGFVVMETLALVTGERPSVRWLAFAGVLAIALGLTLVAFRREASDYFSASRAAIGLETASQDPFMMIIGGLAFVAWGSFVIYLSTR